MVGRLGTVGRGAMLRGGVRPPFPGAHRATQGGPGGRGERKSEDSNLKPEVRLAPGSSGAWRHRQSNFHES